MKPSRESKIISSIRIDAKVHQKIVEMAARERRSLNAQVGYLLEQSFNEKAQRQS